MTHTRFAWIAIAAVACAACGDDDRTAGTDAGRDAGRTDGGGSDTGPGSDAGTDAGPIDAGPPPGDVLTGLVCTDPVTGDVAVSPDGAFVAYVACEGDASDVRVIELATGDETVLGPADPDATVAFSPDSAFVLFGASGTFDLRDVGATSPAVRLTDGSVVETRFVEVTPSAGAAFITLLYSFTLAGDTTIAARDLAAAGTERVLASSDRLEPSLALISNTGQNLFVGEDDGSGFVRYQQVSIEGVAIQMPLPFGPTEFDMIQPGLGNTHGAAHASAGRLVFRKLEDDSEINVLAPSGVDPGHPVLDLTAGGTRYLYFIAGGNVSRHERSATSGSLEMLTSGAARTLATLPDSSRVLFVSSGTLFSIPAEGGAAVELATGVGSGEVGLVSAPDSSEVLVLADGVLQRTPPATADLDRLDGPGVTSPGYLGDGSQAVWLRGGLLVSASGGAAPVAVAPADAWWPIPSAPRLLYIEDGTLRALSP